MQHPDRIILLLMLALTALRYAALAVTPLGLDVEEAQYWLWSQTPDAGYFTKPPMIAWVIGLSSGIAGNTVFGVKAAAPLIQLISALLIGRVGRLASGALAGRLAALIWITLPAGAIGSFVISTDSPMLLCLIAMLLMLAPVARGGRLEPGQAGLAGIFAGLAMMAKYAALYLPAGLVLWWCWQGRHETRLSPRLIAAFVLGAVISLSPNIAWNLVNGFVTVGHIGDNANIGGNETSVLRSLGFLVAQAGIAGPVLFALVITAIAACWHQPMARFWIALAAPAMAVITVQAFLSDANANWAIASWPPLIILVSHWLAGRWRGWQRRLGMLAIAVNGGLAAILLVATMAGSLGPLTPASDPLRRLRGWDIQSRDLAQFIKTHGAEAVITSRRRDAAKLTWGLRDQLVSVELIDGNGIAENHYEQRHAWVPVPGRRVVLVSENAIPEAPGRLILLGPSARSSVTISARRGRDLGFFLAVEK